MKKLATIIAVSAGLLTVKAADAQIGLHVGFHLGPVGIHAVLAQPAPVAVPEYPADYNSDDYYYLPDIDAYYDVTDNCYYYMDGDQWVSAAYLPGEYRNYDWRAFRHYEVRERRPYMHNEVYRERYPAQPQGPVFSNRYDNRDRGMMDQRYGDRGWNNEQRFDNNDRRGFDNHGFNDQNRERNQFRNEDRSYQQPNMPQERSRGNEQPSFPQNNNGFGRGNEQNRGQFQNNQPQGNFGEQRQQSNQNGNWQRGGEQQQNRGMQNSQPANQNWGHDARNNNADQHFAANRESGFGRKGF